MKWFQQRAPIGYPAPHHSWLGNLWRKRGISLVRTDPTEEFRAEVELEGGLTVFVELASGMTEEVTLEGGFVRRVNL